MSSGAWPIDTKKVIWGGAITCGVGGSSLIITDLAALVNQALKSNGLPNGLWVTLLVFFLAAILLSVILGPLFERILGLAYRVVSPQRISNQIPTLLHGSPDRDENVSALEKEAERVFDRYLSRAIAGVSSRVQELTTASTRASRTEVDDLLDDLTSRWTSGKILNAPSYNEAVIRFADPIHGTIEFDRRYMWLIRHPIVQRLHEIRQLLFAFPSFPGGTHTRFSHSLGVAHLAREALRRVVAGGVLYTPSGRRRMTEAERSAAESKVPLATVAGLVHDIAHTALGHSLDRFFGSRYFDATPADKVLLPKILETHLQTPINSIEGVSVESVLRVLQGQAEEGIDGWERFLADLLDSAVDVDRMDYLIRDAHFTGQREGLIDKEALLSGMRPYKKDGSVYLAFEESCLGHVEQFVYARDVMYLRCYEDPYKSVSEWVSTRAVDRLFQEEEPRLQDRLEDFVLLTDSQLVEFVSLLDSARESSRALRDIFQSESLGYSEVISVPLSQNALEGKLGRLQSAYSMNERHLLDMLKTHEKEIAAEAEVEPRDIVLTLPIADVADDRGDDGILILRRTGDGGYKVATLLGDESGSEFSDVLRRMDLVPRQLFDDVESIEDVKQILASHERQGISMLEILRSARSKLRLFCRDEVADRMDEIRDAFVQRGVKHVV